MTPDLVHHPYTNMNILFIPERQYTFFLASSIIPSSRYAESGGLFRAQSSSYTRDAISFSSLPLFLDKRVHTDTHGIVACPFISV